MIEIAGLAFAALAIAFGGLLKGAVGMGAPLVAIPILAGIYAATLAVFVGDESEGKAETRAFLDRRIEGVMKFEKAKAQLLREREGFNLARFLGRLRYPAR